MSPRRALLALSLAAAAAPSPAFDGSSRGAASADFLTVGAGARAAAMGEAYSAAADEATAMYWNPAALTRIEKRSATFMHASYPPSSSFDYAAYGQNLGARGAFGASFQYYSAGGINLTDENGADLGGLTPYDLAFSVGYARTLDGSGPFGGLSVGLAAKLIQSRILDTARTAAVDLGVLSPAYLDGRLRLAFTATNLGGELTFDQVPEPLPFALRAGSSFKITDRWLAALDAAFPEHDDPYVAAGTEYWIQPEGPWRLAGRSGFNSQTIGGVDGFNGVSLGVGLAHLGGRLDYAFTPLGGLGQAHRLSLTYDF